VEILANIFGLAVQFRQGNPKEEEKQ